MKTWVCANCNETVTSVVKDKVWNKPVCHSCKQQALNLNVRFEFDFESINDTLLIIQQNVKEDSNGYRNGCGINNRFCAYIYRSDNKNDAIRVYTDGKRKEICFRS